MADDELIWTHEQLCILEIAKSGHNLCIFGRGGVGKSTVVSEIKKVLEKNGKKCQIVCSSGVACESYNCENAKTVHSHYGLQCAEIPDPLVIERCLARQNIIEEVENIDVLIWDEVSMSSERLFHLVNAIHHRIFQNNYGFGGIQVILVGDFWQMKPVPSIVDRAVPIYESSLFENVFPHRVELTTILRQSESESRLKEALDQLRFGSCDEATEEYFCSLTRDFVACEEVDVVHIYFKKLSVALHNSSVLALLPGPHLKFESVDFGSSAALDGAVDRVLALKPKCKVMLLYNVSDLLRNGTCGEFIGDNADEDGLVVNFPKVGIINVRRQTWYKFDRRGSVEASRTQFPLRLCYAITAHKAQGLTLGKVVVHCSQEFIPGQTYVATSRTKLEENLRLVGFRKRYLLPPPPALRELITHESGNPVPTFRCCRKKELSDVPCSEDVECSRLPTEDDTMQLEENHTEELFESGDDVSVKLEDVLLCLFADGKEVCHPLPDSTAEKFLESLLQENYDDEFSQSIKAAARYASDNLETFELLACIIWRRISVLFNDYLVENWDEVHMTNKDFTYATSKLHELFLTDEYRRDVLTAFSVGRWTDINDGQRSLAAQMVFHLYHLFIAYVRQRVTRQEKQDAVPFKVAEMEEDGKGKIRYIGGWAIRKVLEKSRRYINEHKMSSSLVVLAQAKKEVCKVDLLENNVIVPFQIISSVTKSEKTLLVTEARQYRERGLIHISDAAHQFFMTLEQERVNKININRLVAFQANMVEVSIEEISKNQELKCTFCNLFEFQSIEDQVLVDELYRDVISRYVRMGAGQFLRDFRRDYHVKSH